MQDSFERGGAVPADDRRRRRRARRDDAAETASGPATGQPSPGSRGASREAGERGLRALVGAGPSQVGVQGALRGRDVNRPTEQDLSEAEREVVIVRRKWRPPPGSASN